MHSVNYYIEHIQNNVMVVVFYRSVLLVLLRLVLLGYWLVIIIQLSTSLQHLYTVQ